MASGYISRLNSGADHGFILESGSAEEIEFHWTVVTAANLEQLAVGQKVEFEKRDDHRDQSRLRAINVRLLA
jgi:cold shock CspA family protein